MTQGFDEFLAERGYTHGYNHDFQKAYDYGAQSRQVEIDGLQKQIDEALNKLCQLQYASAERVYNDVSKILKGQNHD